MSLLMSILSHAVPGACIDSVEISCVRYRSGTWFYIYVTPDQSSYWKRFRERYPECTRLAWKRNAYVHTVCPEFCSRDALIDWLSEVLGLTDGEHKLLLLDVGL